jgi:hypothetical protein
MKNLILILSLCFFLFSCFEKEEEVTVVPEEEIEAAPIEGNVMECEIVIKFIEEMQSVDPPSSPEEPRATIDKYTFDGKIVYMLMTPSSYFTDILPVVIDSNCNLVCAYSQIEEYNTCDDLNVQEVKFIEFTWKDNR